MCLNNQTKEYIEWFVWAFEKKYGRGSWERTLAEKRREQSKQSGEHADGRKSGDDNEWRKGKL